MTAKKSESQDAAQVVDQAGQPMPTGPDGLQILTDPGQGVAETLAAAEEGQVVLRHPTTFGVYQTVPAADVDRWSSQGWVRLK